MVCVSVVKYRLLKAYQKARTEEQSISIGRAQREAGIENFRTAYILTQELVTEKKVREIFRSRGNEYIAV